MTLLECFDKIGKEVYFGQYIKETSIGCFPVFIKKIIGNEVYLYNHPLPVHRLSLYKSEENFITEILLSINESKID